VWHSTGFRLHTVAYGLTNGFLVGTWMLAGAGFFWPFFPAASWGIGLGIHGAATSAMQRHRQRHLAKPLARLPARPPSLGRPPAVVEGHQPQRWRDVVVAMFCDVVDSTTLTRAIGDDDWTRIRAQHMQLLRDCYDAHHGEEVSATGDGFLARFASPTDAARCAIEIQRRLQAKRNEAFALTLRIGLHSGEAVVERGDILGTVVNLAARVMSEAAPGEVLVTETIADQLDARFQVEDRGLRTLKGFREPRHLLALCWEDAS
jgi:class 3 adenylate cyclase